MLAWGVGHHASVSERFQAVYDNELKNWTNREKQHDFEVTTEITIPGMKDWIVRWVPSRPLVESG